MERWIGGAVERWIGGAVGGVLVARGERRYNPAFADLGWLESRLALRSKVHPRSDFDDRV